MRGPHVVDRPQQIATAVRSLIEIAESRARAAASTGDGVPHLLALIDGSACRDVALVQRLLDAVAGSAVGISVIWIATSAAAVTRHASAVLTVEDDRSGSPTGRWWSTDPSTPDVDVDLEPIGGDAGERVGRALAPIADSSTWAPAMAGDVSLFAVLGVHDPDAEWVSRRWRRGDHQRLQFPVGRTADGVLELDLVEHGPHTLIGGTSGSGKSELLQTLVTGLAASHPPDRLQFLFVDYKGGAATRLVEGLPHTVGCVTNLDAGLARRAMVSLRAELQRRMSILEGVAKDVGELRARHPESAPASLVIVVDELATLVKEIPEFVDGLVDVAQRGRSLGIHLVLATQRPSGSVSESILANTNLRIALRVLDAAESGLIVGNDAAARIPAWRRGGAVVRHGERQTTDVQTAYGGGLAGSLAGRPGVHVSRFDGANDVPARGTTIASGAPGASQIEVLVGAIKDAAAALALPAPRRPWCPPLPHELPTSALPAPQWPAIVFGLIDAPEHQRQHPATLDLSAGVLLVFGGSGSGRTTLLTTLAHQLSSIRDVEIVIIDAGSPALASLSELTGVVAVVAADDLEAVTRLIVTLEAELAHRRADPNRRRPPIVVLIDGWPALMSALAVESWSERLAQVVTECRQLGMAVVITSDRTGAIAPAVHAASVHRLMLRHSDPSRYHEHGLTAETLRHLDLPPGRGLFDGQMVQIARADGMTAGRRRVRDNTITSRRLPTRIDLVDVPAADRRPLQVVVGVADITGEPVAVDLERSDVVVIGSARSGRSTVLATIAAGLGDRHEVCVMSDREPDAGVLQRLVDHDRCGPATRPRVLLVDDLASFDEPGMTTLWTSIAQTRNLRIVAARPVTTTPGYHPLLARLRAARQLVFLQPDDPAQFMAVTGLRRSLRPGLDTPPGRAIVVADRNQTTVQIAVPG
jgi:S-DNA-T family DNA segregation ATPase FtsK/SpoIIIE